MHRMICFVMLPSAKHSLAVKTFAAEGAMQIERVGQYKHTFDSIDCHSSLKCIPIKMKNSPSSAPRSLIPPAAIWCKIKITV